MPAHPVALELIRRAGVPVAAPSANLFGHISPTTAAHVLCDLDGRIDAVLDGGPTAHGVESTVLDPCQSPMVIYRPGAVTAEQIREAGGAVEVFRTPREISREAEGGAAFPGIRPAPLCAQSAPGPGGSAHRAAWSGSGTEGAWPARWAAGDHAACGGQFIVVERATLFAWGRWSAQRSWRATFMPASRLGRATVHNDPLPVAGTGRNWRGHSGSAAEGGSEKTVVSGLHD